MIKVLHIYKSYFPDTQGGIEQFIRNLTAATTALNIQNSLLTTSHLPSTVTSTLKIYRTPVNFTIASCPFSTRFYHQFKKLVAKHDIIHVHFPWPFGELVAQWVTNSNQPLIITYHADIIRQKYYKWLYYPFMKRLLHRADQIIATSQNLLQSSPVLSALSGKTTVIPLALNPADYSAPSPTLLEHWQQQVGQDFILFIGQFRHYKGIDILLKALKDTSLPCVLIGNGQIKPELEQLRQQLGLSKVYFVGSVNEADKIALLTLCKILVLPSTTRSEAFGLVLLEGLLFSKPLITTELNTGTSFVNRHHHTGLVIPPNDVNALKQALLTLMFDDLLYKKLSDACMTHLQENFAINQVANGYYELYHDQKIKRS